MAEKKRTKTSKKKVTRKSTVTAAAKRSSPRSASHKKVGRAVKKHSPGTAATEAHSPEPSTLSGRVFSAAARSPRSAIARSAGQAGDVQGLSRKRIVDSESVE